VKGALSRALAALETRRAAHAADRSTPALPPIPAPADFRVDRRLLAIAAIAAVVGVIGAGVAYALVRLIGLFTNLLYYQRFSFTFVSPAGTPLGGLSVLVPVFGGLLIGLMARYGSVDLDLQLPPEGVEAEVAAAGKSLGKTLREPLASADVLGHGSAVAAADEALAHVVLEASGRPLVVSNVDLSETRVAGLGIDLVTSFLREFAEGGGLTMHVRLIGGDDPQHVLEAIFKALGAALAQAGRARTRKE
jgi:imidazoleglycerol phosphate dehydratase HisB